MIHLLHLELNIAFHKGLTCVKEVDAMSKGRVLVVDDEAEVRKSVRLILSKAGYDVIEAEDGEAGGQRTEVMR